MVFPSLPAGKSAYRHNMKLQILAFRSWLPGVGITFDRVKALERKSPFRIWLGARLRAEKKLLRVQIIAELL